MKLSRRSFLGGAFAVAAVGATTASASTDLLMTTDEIELAHNKIPVTNLSKPFDGFRIGFLTDMHLGPCVPIEWIEDTLVRLTDAGMNLLVLGGDNIWIPESRLSTSFGDLRGNWLKGVSVAELPTFIYTELAKLIKRFTPEQGVISVMGNHDLWVAPQVCNQQFSAYGIANLVNRKVSIKRADSQLEVVGVDDFWNGVPYLPTDLDLSTSRASRVLISHNPDYVSGLLAEFSGINNSPLPPVFDLALCGHTHGGQIKIPGLGALHYNIRDSRLGEGLFTDKSGHQVYTSRGIGVVELPYRINCPAEATLIELVAA